MRADTARIERYAGRINVDIVSGWEAGLKGKERLAGRLWPRQAPIHLVGQRLMDWELGRDAAARLIETRNTVFSGATSSGPVTVTRKGWLAQTGRWKTVNQMVKDNGVIGDVLVSYTEDGDIVRSQYCAT
ncbi:hypothetical protein RBE51_20400 [Pseudomonas taiwanensis]|uniref:hypothetical protein n=1 Tax=Pseudomonas taiwanensis TaxID=470150 RepID=UPI0028DFE5BE|nr:hypothetical protein [Pseudomonas taiwanensis]MDT8925156.1 hypothetical protein [Pseudomonas taiwanensis]